MNKNEIIPKRIKKRVAEMTKEEYEANKVYRRLEGRRYHAKVSEDYKQVLRERAKEYAKRKRASMTNEERTKAAKRQWQLAKQRMATKSAEEKQSARRRRAEIWKRYYENNRKSILERQKELRASLPSERKETLKEKSRKRSSEWRKKRTDEEKTKNAEYQRMWMNERRATDLHFKILDNLRSRLVIAVKRRNSKKANKRTHELFGVEWDSFILHLESQFDSRMKWDNWGRNGWHIDHIVPLAAFDLAKKKELLVASFYLNHRPCWGKENMKKGGSMPAKKDVPLALRRKLYELDPDFFERKTYVRRDVQDKTLKKPSQVAVKKTS